MKKILILRGLPASGKSSFCEDFIKKNPTYKRMSRDLFREMLLDISYGQDIEKFITKQSEIILEALLRKGYNVVIDNVNLSQKYCNDILTTAAKIGDVQVEEKFFDTPLKTCIERDSKRTKKVGEEVIQSFYDRYLKRNNLKKIEPIYFPKPSVNKLTQDPMLPSAIICDLDGTLALFGDKNPFDRDFENDEVSVPVRDIIEKFGDEYGDDDFSYEIIFFSGRDEKFKDQTIEFLKKHISHRISYQLYMRPTGDQRKDSILKKEMFEKYIKDTYYVQFVIDDRLQVLRECWWEMGLFVLNVNQGLKEF